MASLDPMIREWMRDTVTVRQLATQDGYGQETHDEGVQYQARRVRGQYGVYNTRGEHVKAEGVVWIAPKDGVLPDIKPGETVVEFENGEKPLIMAVGYHDDTPDMDHVKVWYGGSI